jgi:hypothetical protein
MVYLRTAMVTAALILATGAIGAPVTADASINPAWRDACTRDAFVHCRLHALAFDIPGVRDCLVRNLDKVSEPCRGVIRAAQADHTPMPIGPIQSVAPAPH